MPDLTSQAIDAALQNKWEEAISINLKILKQDPNGTSCLNRLGTAYLQTGQNEKAAKYFRKVLRLDKYDPIAKKNLDRLETGRKGAKPTNLTNGFVNNFVEEPGKTKLVNLVNLAGSQHVLKQNCADKLKMAPKRHTVVLTDSQDNYLGALPDDLGHRLTILIAAGNKYEATVKSVSKNSLTVLLREIFRAKKFHNSPSFLASTNPDYVNFLREDLLEQEPPAATLATDEDDGNDDGARANTPKEQTEEADGTAA